MKQIAIFLIALAVALPAAAGGANCDGSADELAKMKTKLANKAALKKVWAKVEPGSEVQYVVKRDGAEVSLDATLAHVPVDLQEKWIAEHTEEHHADQQLVSTD